MKNIKVIFAFAVGVATGTAASCLYFKNKYEKIAQEEIDSVKETFLNLDKNKREESAEISKRARVKPNVVENYKEIADEYNLGTFDNEKEERVIVDRPYVISPAEFGDFEDYETISLTYYADHVLTDDADEFVEDVEMTVGYDSLNHFGEYEDDAVHVRNDRLKADFEILRDERRYDEVWRSKPYLRSVEEYEN